MRWRGIWVRVHRWVGLPLAGILSLIGLTGSLLAFYPELERAINPQYYPHSECGARLGPGELAARLEANRPGLRVNGVILEANQKATLASVAAQPGGAPLAYDNIFVDPCDGTILYERRFGAIGDGLTNLMGFIYRLHYMLALGEWGLWTLGVVALIWTFDCFVGIYLTLPARRRARPPRMSPTPPGEEGRGHSCTAGVGDAGREGRLLPVRFKPWLERWAPAWTVRWRAGSYKRNFDLHRAPGLWLWTMLLVFAWSSVYMNLGDSVYTCATRAVLDFRAPWTELAPRAEPLQRPQLDWRAAQARAEHLMTRASERHDFAVERAFSLRLDRALGVYEYRVRSSLDIQDKRGTTRLYFDADSGAERLLLLPVGQYAGNTLSSWLFALHEANVFGLPYRIVVSALGLAIVMLSVTGVIIWLKKRHGRLRMRRSSALRSAGKTALPHWPED